jgi:hypothetical protein
MFFETIVQCIIPHISQTIISGFFGVGSLTLGIVKEGARFQQEIDGACRRRLDTAIKCVLIKENHVLQLRTLPTAVFCAKRWLWSGLG